MNRDLIEKGKTAGKWAESYVIFGGLGAVLYPLVFWYTVYAAIEERDDFIFCKYTTMAEEPNEEHDNNLRFAMFWNCVMMVIYLALHYTLFSRPDDVALFKKIGYVFPVVCCLEIIFAVINVILAGISICLGEMYGTAALVSSLAIIAINLFTIVGSTVYFCVKTRIISSQVAPRGGQGRPAQADVTNSDVSQ